jgi:hypothetical protein
VIAAIELYQRTDVFSTLSFTSMSFACTLSCPQGSFQEPSSEGLVIDEWKLSGVLLGNHFSEQCRTVIAITLPVEFQYSSPNLTAIATVRETTSQAVNKPFVPFAFVSGTEAMELAFADIETRCGISTPKLALAEAV